MLTKAIIQPSVDLTEQEIKEKREDLQVKIHALKDLLANLTGAERLQKVSIQEALVKYKATIRRLDLWLHFGILPQLDLEPLTWRDEEGYPKLIILPMSRNDFTITAEVHGRDLTDLIGRWEKNRGPLMSGVLFDDSLPDSVREKYKDVEEQVRKIARKTKKTTTLSAVYGGLFPEKIREKIKEVKGLPNNYSCYLLSEAGERQLTQKQPAPKPPKLRDPLLLVFDGEIFSVLDKFDVTELEDHISEFTF